MIIEAVTYSTYLRDVVLARLAYIDGLSGLYNRRHFDIELERMSSSAFSESTTVVLFLVDIGNFKAYNDCYGHQAGDACCNEWAKTLVTAVRSNDVAARYGGEEFGVVSTSSDEAESLIVAERIRATVEALAIPHAASGPGVITVSIGAASAVSGSGATIRELVGAADAALY